MRNFSQIAGTSAPHAGLRAQPSVAPVPNAVPAGVQTGAPPRVLFLSTLIAPAKLRKPTLLVPGTAENRTVTITAPNVGFTIYVGNADVTPANGMSAPRGQPFYVPLVGLQELWAVTDAPIYLRLTAIVSIVLMAEQGRPVGRIGNE